MSVPPLQEQRHALDIAEYVNLIQPQTEASWAGMYNVALSDHPTVSYAKMPRSL
jgi:hypothetical protein